MICFWNNPNLEQFKLGFSSMKKSLVAIALLLSTEVLASEAIQVGCVKQILLCEQSDRCQWVTQLGRIAVVDLVHKGSGPTYEIYEGRREDLVLDGTPLRLSIYQRREDQLIFNYLTIEMPIADSIVLTGSGQNYSLVRFFNPDKKMGYGIRCSTELEEPDEGARKH